MQTVPDSSIFFIDSSSFSQVPQIPFNYFRISQFLSDSLRFSQIVSNWFIFFPNLPIFLKFSQIPSNSSRFFLFFILSDYSGCFSMSPDCSRFFRIFSNGFKDTVRNPQDFFKFYSSIQIIQILSDSCKFFKSLPNSSSFFRFS